MMKALLIYRDLDLSIKKLMRMLNAQVKCGVQ